MSTRASEIARAWVARLRVHTATLPWQDLEDEARRQGCSPADIFFDRAGHDQDLSTPEGCGAQTDSSTAGPYSNATTKEDSHG